GLDGPRRGSRNARHSLQAGDAARPGRGTVRDRGGLRDPAGGLLQVPGCADLPDGAAAPPFRAVRLGRNESRHAVLDHRADLFPAEPGDIEAEVMAATMTRPTDDLKGRRVLVVGLARTGVAAARFLARSG